MDKKLEMIMLVEDDNNERLGIYSTIQKINEIMESI